MKYSLLKVRFAWDGCVHSTSPSTSLHAKGSSAAQAAEGPVGLSVPHRGSRCPAKGAQTHLWSLHSWLETGEVPSADAEKDQYLQWLESLFPKANLSEGPLG